MAHKRQDTYAKPREWAKHLRPFGKREQSGRERRTAKAQVKAGEAESLYDALRADDFNADNS